MGPFYPFYPLPSMTLCSSRFFFSDSRSAGGLASALRSCIASYEEASACPGWGADLGDADSMKPKVTLNASCPEGAACPCHGPSLNRRSRTITHDHMMHVFLASVSVPFRSFRKPSGSAGPAACRARRIRSGSRSVSLRLPGLEKFPVSNHMSLAVL